jgi:integrase
LPWAWADAERAPATIERALAAIAAAHRAAGAGALRTDGPRQVLRSYRLDRATIGTGVRVRKAAPVTIAALRAMTDALDRNSLAGIRDTALLVLGFALGARRSELAALDTPLGDSVDVARRLDCQAWTIS